MQNQSRKRKLLQLDDDVSVEMYWSVVGCKYYPISRSVVVDQVLKINKTPIPGHDWNIAVFTQEGQQVGTLNQHRIASIWMTFPDEGVECTVEYIKKQDRIVNLMYVKA